MVQIDEAFVTIQTDFSDFDRQVQRGLKDFDRTFERQIKRTGKEMESQLEKSAKRATDEIEDEFDKTGRQLGDTFGDSTRGVEADFDSMAGAGDNAGGDIIGSMKGAAGAAGVGALIAALAAATTAMIGLGVEALNTRGELLRASGAFQSGFSTDNAERLREIAHGIAEDFGILSQESIPVLADALRSGIPEDELERFSEIVGQVATVTGATFDQASETVAGFSKTFGLSFEEVADLLTAARDNISGDFADIQDALGETSAFAASSGVGLEQMIALLATLDMSGRDSGAALGDLAAIFEEFDDSSSALSQSFEKISGKTFQEFIASGGNVQEALAMLKEAADAGDLSIAELGATGEIFRGGFIAASEEGASAFDEAMKDIQDSTGETADRFGVLDDEGALATQQLAGSFETLKADLGETFAPVVQELVDNLIPLFDDLEPLIETFGELFAGSLERTLVFLEPFLEFLTMVFAELEKTGVIDSLIEVMNILAETLAESVGPLLEAVFNVLKPFLPFLDELITLALIPLITQFKAFALLLDFVVVPILNTVAGWLETLFDKLNIAGAVERAKEAFRGLPGVIRGAINSIIGAWNRLDFSISVSIPSWVPGIGGRGFHIGDIFPDIPRLQTGGIITGEGMFIGGEGGRDEAVIPLESSRGDAALASALSRAMDLSGNGRGDINIRVDLSRHAIQGLAQIQIDENDRRTVRQVRAGAGVRIRGDSATG